MQVIVEGNRRGKSIERRKNEGMGSERGKYEGKRFHQGWNKKGNSMKKIRGKRNKAKRWTE
jgi:hypothetical protein